MHSQVRELEAQRHELREIVAEERAEVLSLRGENERLQAELTRLRGPLGGLAAGGAIAAVSAALSAGVQEAAKEPLAGGGARRPPMATRAGPLK